MILATEDGKPLRGDMIVSVVQRFDLAPMPSTLEATVRLDDSTKDLIADGGVIRAGSDLDKYRIIKSVEGVAPLSQGSNGPVPVKSITAVLDGMQSLMWAQPRAVVKSRVGMLECFRTCGATTRMGDDVLMQRMFVPRGHIATYALAELMAEEFCAPVWRDGSLSVKRLSELFLAVPSDRLELDVAEAKLSGWLEHLATVSAFSCATDGSVILPANSNSSPKPSRFVPHAPVRVLNNLARWLAVRHCLPGTLAAHVRAGDVVEMASVKHVVVTAAHAWSNGADGGGSNQTTQLWLGQIKS